ncbi:TTC30 [Lepeophtheirus salmonis]|uniref:Tetratricopeptide repeat protein 30 n=1 Tax=Lepeophtheirus salmonis TaxID=72036 RepID=A0A7R8CX89_LEPSM|nr:TTC30 [Lepeophtheirus salmonis]CAF2912937.1 TTC30 [Lepeophtheirus salmonis]
MENVLKVVDPSFLRTRNLEVVKTLCKVGIAESKDVDEAVKVGKDAFRRWKSTEEVAIMDVLDNGKPIWEARMDMDSVIGALEYYGAYANNGFQGEYYKLAGGSFAYVTKEPIGLVAGIGAWNYPLQTATWKFTPLTALYLAEALKEAGLPDGVFNIIQGEGETGALLSSHPDVLMEIRHVTLELGGKSPLIIFDDADLKNAVKGALMANFFSQGQVCSNGTRVFVQKGDPLKEDTTVGATIHPEHAERVLQYIKEAKEEGAKIECGGEKIVIDGDLSGGRNFGAVACVLPFESEDEVVSRANDTPFGLAGGVFTKDLNRAHRIADSIDAGVVWVNTFNICTPEVPFGGYKMSGIGKRKWYNEAINILNYIYDSNPTSRAALSLLGHCYYYTQDFVNAANCYEQLTNYYPEVDDYRVYYAQSLYQACLYEEAMKITVQIENPELQHDMLKLQAAIKYGEEDLAGAKSLVDKCPDSDPETEINRGCLLYKEGRYEEALAKFIGAQQVIGYDPHLSYNIALCHYRVKDFAPALKHIADIIEKGNKRAPRIESLIEAFNLKAAIEFLLKNVEAAQEALTDMPPRSEDELDAVTLHNQALMNMESKPTEGFEKLQFLLQQSPFPPETFGNLLLLYCKYEYFDLAADVLAENAHLTYKYLSPHLYDFLEALITQQTSPEEAYRKFDVIASKHTEQLRKCTKTSKIYWDLEMYEQVEKIFRKSVEFCNESDVWKLNVAHVLFMQENNKFKEATGFYEPIVRKNFDSILNVSAIVLANLCVSYIMTSQNEEAEELMRKIEKEEETVAYDDADKKVFHLCIVNLVIGTLYCAKGNYEFGISRVIKSLEPYNKKLGTDTWFYAKRSFLSLIENLSKHMITVRDSVIEECIQFLDHCEIYGRGV